MFSRVQNTAGFSLIEGMIILTVITTVALSMGQVAVFNARSQNNVKVWQDINIALREVGSLLNRTDICDANFAGLAADGNSLQYFKYSMDGGLADTNIIAHVGSGVAPYRGSSVRITEMKLLAPSSTEAPDQGSINSVTGDGTVYVKASFEYTGDQSQIAATRSKTTFFKILANFANIVPAAALPTGNATFDGIALAMNCATKATSPDTASLDVTAPVTNLLSPYNGASMIMQDCKIVRQVNPVLSYCKPQSGVQ